MEAYEEARRNKISNYSVLTPAKATPVSPLTRSLSDSPNSDMSPCQVEEFPVGLHLGEPFSCQGQGRVSPQVLLPNVLSRSRYRSYNWQNISPSASSRSSSGESKAGPAIPDRTQVRLSDETGRERNYTVQYAYIRMTRAQAHDYIDRISKLPHAVDVVRSV